MTHRRAFTDDLSPDVEQQPAGPDPSDPIVAELADLAADATRTHLAVEWTDDPAAADAWFGRRVHDDRTHQAVAAILGSDECRRHPDPRALFALAPFFCTANSLARPAGLAPGVGRVAALMRGDDRGEPGMSIDDLRVLDDVCREALAAIPRGGGTTNRVQRWKSDVAIFSVCRDVEVLRLAALQRYGSLADFFAAKYQVWARFVQKCADEAAAQRSKGGTPRALPARLCLWDMLKRDQYDPMTDTVFQPPARRTDDPWSEIRNFLGLPQDCQFTDGWIPVGFQIHPHHEALGMQMSTRRPNPLTGTIADVKSISRANYTVRGDHQYFSIAHHVDVPPERYLVLCCTPENFHLFRDRWFQDLTRVPPSLEEYRQYGWRRAELEEGDTLMGCKVSWRKP